ncbi:electron transfer flavoprotein subunit beta/FixA family protein [Alicyclobacillus cycloheptanicus]|uniref:Electron transfer flavoprotein subunit beta n=1 Tax=Alicyclobacillus cycloheptanicus TaxID=1457 RepID=A0ABT9XKL5_9BACL|nr:electron transfer flavoprotein subunit beta/FixA family protein [Alicyclobacillus cycloheptanicus]MDQ0190594.1 electron transfer flavoprotein beta subunit [Alicyclobacillus cycloheptanicus]WDM01801.1 electron transfer flavoprotein subunit beta/FixA family protein [Alicyclobacillus cycloheptanicus]
MNILVCLKQTFDTEERITVENGAVKEDGVKFVINPYDEYAVEEAIRLKEEGDAEVTVVTIGPDRAEEALRTALAMGADEAILVDDPAAFGDEYTAAKVLAKVAQRKQYDLIIGGNQAVDDGSGQVAVRLAEELGIPHISTLTKLVVEGNQVTGHRDAEGDEEIVTATLPVLVTAQQGLNDPRYPSLIGIRKAGKKPLERLTLADLGLDAEDVKPRTAVIETFLPKPKEAGKVLQGELADQVKELVQSLRTVDKVVG